MYIHAKRKGNIGELALAKFLSQNGYSVFAELGDISKIDIIAEKDGKLLRFQAKSAKVNDGKIILYLKKSGPNYAYKYKTEDFDYLSLYDLENDRLYIVPSSVTETQDTLTLRVDKPKNGQYNGIHSAEEFLAENVNMGP